MWEEARYWASYEKLPNVCYICGCVDHIKKDCEQVANSDVVKSYGPSLTAYGFRSMYTHGPSSGVLYFLMVVLETRLRAVQWRFSPEPLYILSHPWRERWISPVALLNLGPCFLVFHFVEFIEFVKKSSTQICIHACSPWTHGHRMSSVEHCVFLRRIVWLSQICLWEQLSCDQPVKVWNEIKVGCGIFPLVRCFIGIVSAKVVLGNMKRSHVLFP